MGNVGVHRLGVVVRARDDRECYTNSTNSLA